MPFVKAKVVKGMWFPCQYKVISIILVHYYCRYKTANFHPNPHNGNPLVRPSWISKRLCFVTDVVGVIQNYIQAYVDWTCPHQLDHCITNVEAHHDDVIRWKHFPCYWPCLRGINRPIVNYPHNCQWSGALMFSLICSWANVWANNREVGDLRHRCAHYPCNE